MAIFAIIPQPGENLQRLPRTVAAAFPIKFDLDGGHGWLVAAAGPAKDISDKLGITDGSNGTALVIEVASYFGRANPNIWSWIKANWDVPKNG